MPRFLRSTTTRFIALVFALQLVATASILLFVHEASQRALEGEQRALVTELHDDLVAGFAEGGQANLVKLIDARLAMVRSDVAVILLTSPNGEPIAGNIAAWPAAVAYQNKWRTLDLYRIASDRPEHIGLITSVLPNGAHLLTGHVIDGDLLLARINAEAMIAAFGLAVPLTLFIALILGRVINARVRTISHTTEAVGSGDLSTRVQQDGSGDAFDSLGTGVNRMLDRVETLVGELRIVTDGLAHDLRSPITRLKSVVEQACVDVKDPAALKALERVSTEVEALLSMLTTALEISRAEAGIGRDRFAVVNVATLLNDVIEVYGPVAEEQGLSITADAPSDLSVALHRELISQSLANLIENALKYAQGGHHIVLSAGWAENWVMISVSDDGIGIAQERRSDAVRRFGRLDPARHISGSGLGLSLVEAVARLHGGDISLEDNRPGLRVTLSLRQ